MTEECWDHSGPPQRKIKGTKKLTHRRLPTLTGYRRVGVEIGRPLPLGPPESAVFPRRLPCVVGMAESHEVALVVGVWPCASTAIDVVDISARWPAPHGQRTALVALTEWVLT